ncbi:TIGR00282 family metallophosphoesterase [soil metagenome]
MKILYIGDIMAQAGIKTVEALLPKLKSTHKPDVIVGQAENVTDGKSMSMDDMKHLQSLGIDFFTGGNHTPAKSDIHEALKNNSEPVIGPANMTTCPGQGWKYFDTGNGKVLFISLLGTTVGREVIIDNPLQSVDNILAKNEGVSRVATIVNFHGDFSSEKRIIGYYLDGRVSAVVGDHWHVPTNDAMVLPKGTAHISDVGMCGVLHSSLGVSFESVVPRWRDGKITKNKIIDETPYQFNAVLIDVNNQTGLATSIDSIQEFIT